MKKYLLLLILLLIPINVYASRDRFSISCNTSVFRQFDSFYCRTSITSSFSFNKIEFKINVSEGINIDTVRSNHSALWKVEMDGNIIVATLRQDRTVTDLQEFGIVLFDATGSGNQQIEVTEVVLTNTKNDNTLELSGATQEIKILSSESRLREITIDGNIVPRFSPEVFIYDVEIDLTTDEIFIGATTVDRNANVSGTGTITLDTNQKEFILPIYVKSAGDTSRIYVLKLRRTGTIHANIMASNINISKDEDPINFDFRPETYSYLVEVDNLVRSININVELNDETLVLVKDFGNRKVDLTEGDNLVLVKIENQNGEVRHYVINVRRMLSNKSENNFLQSLTIAKHNLKFNKRVKRYELAIRSNTKELDIEAIAEHNSASVAIVGNENLEPGSIIRIIVTAENGSRMIYQITMIEKPFSWMSVLYVILLPLVTIIFIRIHKYRIKKSKIKAKLVDSLFETMSEIEIPIKKDDLPILKQPKEMVEKPTNKVNKNIKEDTKKMPETISKKKLDTNKKSVMIPAKKKTDLVPKKKIELPSKKTPLENKKTEAVIANAKKPQRQSVKKKTNSNKRKSNRKNQSRKRKKKK